MKKTLLTILGLLSQIGMANATTSSESISIFSDICEKINQEEPVSKARLKAIDKGVFNAIAKLPVLEIAKKNLGEYDFNILVYNLVDNYVENLNTKTTKQTKEQICVNISGHIKGNNIISAVIDAKNNIDARAAQQEKTESVEEFLGYDDNTKNDDSNTKSDDNTTKYDNDTEGYDDSKEDEQKIQKILEEELLPQDEYGIEDTSFDESNAPHPKTQYETDFSQKAIANKVIVVEDSKGNKINEAPTFKPSDKDEDELDLTPQVEESIPPLAGTNADNQEIIVQDGDTIVIVNNEKEKSEQNFETTTPTEKTTPKEEPKDKVKTKGLVYIADTTFYDNSTSKKFSETAKKLFYNNDYFLVTEDKDKADYIVTPKVLRSKVDSINAETNRMQMVVMMECRDLLDDSISSKHQNRFTLFSTEDDEQEVAKNLINKLIEAASEQTITKIEQTERKRKNIKTLPKIITPTGPVQEMDSLLYL